MVYKEGLIYEGSWDNDLRVNYGILKHESGTMIYKGEW